MKILNCRNTLVKCWNLAARSISQSLAYRFTVAELEDLLRTRGQPHNGKKDELILRLVQADPDGSAKLIAGPTVLECSPRAESWPRHI
ncbi:MAG: SAP domain-containing protein [Ardenticatenia bacterium]|nr:SAP domain-containing protein [Ardenticatenia bacterium]